MNFIVFQLKFIKFKPKIKFIKFELHNYVLMVMMMTTMMTMKIITLLQGRRSWCLWGLDP